MANDNGSAVPGGFQLALHPFYPLDAVIRGYVENDMTTPYILAAFATPCVLAVSIASQVIKRSRRTPLSTSEHSAALWFVLCSCIHSVLEGYFAWNHKTLGSHMTYLGQMWKEYALSDSRYLTSDPFVTTMESMTAMLWGPLSMVCAYFIATDHPLRHQLQTVISCGQLYGVVLYYATCWFDEAHHDILYSIPHPAYFWGYYVLLNAFWVFIPAALIWQSTCASYHAFAVATPRPKAA